MLIRINCQGSQQSLLSCSFTCLLWGAICTSVSIFRTAPKATTLPFYSTVALLSRWYWSYLLPLLNLLIFEMTLLIKIGVVGFQHVFFHQVSLPLLLQARDYGDTFERAYKQHICYGVINTFFLVYVGQKIHLVLRSFSQTQKDFMVCPGSCPGSFWISLWWESPLSPPWAALSCVFLLLCHTLPPPLQGTDWVYVAFTHRLGAEVPLKSRALCSKSLSCLWKSFICK